jgi:hypothetical protein
MKWSFFCPELRYSFPASKNDSSKASQKTFGRIELTINGEMGILDNGSHGKAALNGNH